MTVEHENEADLPSSEGSSEWVASVSRLHAALQAIPTTDDDRKGKSNRLIAEWKDECVARGLIRLRFCFESERKRRSRQLSNGTPSDRSKSVEGLCKILNAISANDTDAELRVLRAIHEWLDDRIADQVIRGCTGLMIQADMDCLRLGYINYFYHNIIEQNDLNVGNRKANLVSAILSTLQDRARQAIRFRNPKI